MGARPRGSPFYSHKAEDFRLTPAASCSSGLGADSWWGSGRLSPGLQGMPRGSTCWFGWQSCRAAGSTASPVPLGSSCALSAHTAIPGHTLPHPRRAFSRFLLPHFVCPRLSSTREHSFTIPPLSAFEPCSVRPPHPYPVPLPSILSGLAHLQDLYSSRREAGQSIAHPPAAALQTPPQLTNTCIIVHRS